MTHPSTAATAALALILTSGCQPDRRAAAPPAPPAEPEPTIAVAARPQLNLDEQGRALRGYDPVAYFTDSQAKPGLDSIRETWDGAEYLFATEENRQAFVAEPEQYRPAHGGFCTFGIVLEKKFDGDPEVWTIRDDRLHIFLNEDVQAKFLSDEASNFARVEANWPNIRGRTAQELEASEPAGEG